MVIGILAPSASLSSSPSPCPAAIAAACIVVDSAISFAGRAMPISAYLTERFGYEYPLLWWMLLVVLAYILFFRVTSVLALKYKNFLRR